MSRCVRCAAVFLSPEHFASPSLSLYSEEYFAERKDYFFRDGVGPGGGSKESPHIADFRAGLDRLEASLGFAGRLLDVGCATGSFLLLARQRGWECQGVEISPFAAAVARERCGCEVFCGQLSEMPIDEDGFDAVTMWDLLEHLPNPVETLTRASQLLKPSGMLLVNTPNEASLLRRLARLLYRGTAGRVTGPVNRLYHDYHLLYFSADSLRFALERAGFDVACLETKHIPLSRGRIPAVTKMAMKVLSLAERALDAEYELLALARNRAAGDDDDEAERSGGTTKPRDDASPNAAGRFSVY